MKKAVKTTLAVVATAAAVASVASVPSLVSAWGDNGGGRPSYTTEEINQLAKDGKWPKDKIVFNSISDGNIGNEKNFVGARLNTGINAGMNNVWNGTDITVEDGKEYIVRLYVHNNNPWGKEGAAKNVRVAFNIPTASAKQVQVTGYISADNASPSRYWDHVNFNSDQPFHLEYVYGSALLENNGAGKGAGVKLSDEIVTRAASKNGINIGYEKKDDGIIPGCFQYSSYVTIRVKAVFDNDHTVNTQVKVLGSGTGYTDTVQAKVGDKVQFQITYRNTSKSEQKNVMIKNVLPKNLRYVPGTTKVYNTNFANGLLMDQDTITGNGLNIGAYSANANAYIRFTAEVVDNTLGCGDNTLVNWAQAWVDDSGVQDYATITLNKVCDNTPDQPNNPDDQNKPNELPNTGPEAVAGGVIATGSIVTAAGYYIASRRSLR